MDFEQFLKELKSRQGYCKLKVVYPDNTRQITSMKYIDNDTIASQKSAGERIDNLNTEIRKGQTLRDLAKQNKYFFIDG